MPLIAGDQDGDRPGERTARQMRQRRGDEGGDAALHVLGAAPVQHALLHHAAEWIVPPSLHRPRGHHIGMAGEEQAGRGRAAAGVEIVDGRRPVRGERHAPAGEAVGGEQILQHVERAGIGWCHGGATQQRSGQG